MSVPAATFGAPSQVRREEMTDALAAAVDRLRARAEEEASLPPTQEPGVAATTGVPMPLAGAATTGRPSGGVPAADAQGAGTATAIEPKPHKHSMSLIGRWRYARKHRREGR